MGKIINIKAGPKRFVENYTNLVLESLNDIIKKGKREELVSKIEKKS